MNKYELAVVVSAKIEDEERAAVVDKCKKDLAAPSPTLMTGARRDSLTRSRR